MIVRGPDLFFTTSFKLCSNTIVFATPLNPTKRPWCLMTIKTSTTIPQCLTTIKNPITTLWSCYSVLYLQLLLHSKLPSYLSNLPDIFIKVSSHLVLIIPCLPQNYSARLEQSVEILCCSNYSLEQHLQYAYFMSYASPSVWK